MPHQNGPRAMQLISRPPSRLVLLVFAACCIMYSQSSRAGIIYERDRTFVCTTTTIAVPPTSIVAMRQYPNNECLVSINGSTVFWDEKFSYNITRFLEYAREGLLYGYVSRQEIEEFSLLFGTAAKDGNEAFAVQDMARQVLRNLSFEIAECFEKGTTFGVDIGFQSPALGIIEKFACEYRDADASGSSGWRAEPNSVRLIISGDFGVISLLLPIRQR